MFHPGQLVIFRNPVTANRRKALFEVIEVNVPFNEYLHVIVIHHYNRNLIGTRHIVRSLEFKPYLTLKEL